MLLNQYQVVLKKVSTVEVDVIRDPKSAADAVEVFLRKTYDGELPDREVFGVLYLNTKNQCIGIEIVSIGNLNAALVHPRETFKGAIVKGAYGIIAFHNHPTGTSSASPEDIRITQRLIEAGVLIGIELLDHVVIGEGNYYSLKEHGDI